MNINEQIKYWEILMKHLQHNSIIFYRIVWDQIFMILFFSIIVVLTYDQYNFHPSESMLDKVVTSIYYSTSTQFTTGYGDITPQTILAKSINVIHNILAYFLLVTEISSVANFK
jgi:hypothetical protein